jgi:tripartite ATP-independent transporter DctP family solute receptor
MDEREADLTCPVVRLFVAKAKACIGAWPERCLLLAWLSASLIPMAALLSVCLSVQSASAAGAPKSIIPIVDQSDQSAKSSQSAKERVLYLAHANANRRSANPTAAMAITFQEGIKKSLGGRVRVEIFPRGLLGKDPQVVELVRKGIIQSAIVSVNGLTKVYPCVDILNDPFRFKDMDEVYKVYDGQFGKIFADDLHKVTGLQVLGYGDTGGLFVLTNSQHKVLTPDDLHGLRIRTMSVQSHKEFLSAMGATPQTIPWREVYGALRNHLVDGQMNPASIVNFAKFDRVQKYLTVTNHIYTPYVWVINAEFMAGLSASERKKLLTAARDGVLASRRFAKNNDHILQVLSRYMQVNYLTPEQHEAFKAQSQKKMTGYFHQKYGSHGDHLLMAYRTSVQ